jgi:ATP-dependent Clp protease ATP-binding subunit ClpA
MARVIQEHIKRPLAEELLFGKLAEGGHVRVEVAADGESLLLTVEPLKRELEDLRGKGPGSPELAGRAGDRED